MKPHTMSPVARLHHFKFYIYPREESPLQNLLQLQIMNIVVRFLLKNLDCFNRLYNYSPTTSFEAEANIYTHIKGGNSKPKQYSSPLYFSYFPLPTHSNLWNSNFIVPEGNSI